MYSVDLNALIDRASGQEAVPADAMSGGAPISIPFAEALAKADFREAHELVTDMSVDGILNWERFDIIPFGRFMTSMATLDRIETPVGQIDFRYGYVGLSIESIAQESLRKKTLREVLVGDKKEAIIAEYDQTLTDRHPRATEGRVKVSNESWARYLRFLYPARTETGIDKVLLFMLFDAV